MLKAKNKKVKNANGENVWWQVAEAYKLTWALRAHQLKDTYSLVYGGEDVGEHCVLMIQVEMSRISAIESHYLSHSTGYYNWEKGVLGVDNYGKANSRKAVDNK